MSETVEALVTKMRASSLSFRQRGNEYKARLANESNIKNQILYAGDASSAFSSEATLDCLANIFEEVFNKEET